MRNIFFLILLALFILPISISGAPATHSPASNNIRYEVRAAWLTTLMGLDWPSKPATTEAQAELQRRDLCRQLDQLKAAGINMVLFQSRIRSTTAYASDIEPWDGVFTGRPGQRPLYDPLLFAINECHKRDMECHAWVVAFPICKVATAKQLGKRALPALHPELCQRCGDQWMMNPGVPATATYLANVCKEIVTKYAVDGIHLDYIRYPEASIPFNDNATYRRYGQSLNKATWRTQNIDRCVQAIHKAVKEVRPWVKLSCSPVGKYADLSRYSSRGWNARDAVSQDAQRWLREGWMDMLFPMMYFDGDHFYPFLANWKENDFGRPIVPGLGIYFLNEREKNWPLLTIQRQMNVSRDEGLSGQAFFRTRFLLNNEKGLRSWLQTHIKVSPRGISLFVESLNNGIYRVAFGSHTCFVLKDNEKAMPHGITRDPVADLLNVIFNHLPACLIVFLLGITLHLLHICLRIRRQCTRHHLQIIWGNFEIRSKG